MTGNVHWQRAISSSEKHLRHLLELKDGTLADGALEDTACMVLGTGWGDAITLESEKSVSLRYVLGFENLETIEGHKRLLCRGILSGCPVIALRGRIHLNESVRPEHALQVRLQIDMLLALGVKTLILTNAAGALGDKASVGDVVVTDGFVSLYAPDMPLFAGEFCSPDDVLDPELQRMAVASAPEGLTVRTGGYAMLRGPFFEGRKYDKPLLRQTGATCVGMSTLPEACFASLYKPQGVRVLALSFITNSDTEVHSHEENLARAKEKSALLGALLTNIVGKLNAPNL
jgi:purine-nucleoside phosphorylase